MITRNKELTNPFEKELIALCCKQEMEHQIVPTLNQMERLQMTGIQSVADYVYLLEKLIKSAAVLHKMRYIEEKAHTALLAEDIKRQAFHLKSEMKFQQFVSLYLTHQGKISEMILSPGSLLGPTVDICDLKKTVAAASNGFVQVKMIAGPWLSLKNQPIQQFNSGCLQFLKNIIDQGDEAYFESMYGRTFKTRMKKAAFVSAMMALSFRLYWVLMFFEEVLGEMPPMSAPENFDVVLFEQFLLFQIQKSDALITCPEALAMI